MSFLQKPGGQTIHLFRLKMNNNSVIKESEHIKLRKKLILLGLNTWSTSPTTHPITTHIKKKVALHSTWMLWIIQVKALSGLDCQHSSSSHISKRLWGTLSASLLLPQGDSFLESQDDQFTIDFIHVSLINIFVFCAKTLF